MNLRFGTELDDEMSDADVDEIVAALKTTPGLPDEPAPKSSARPAPRRASRRKTTPPPAEPAPDVSRETSGGPDDAIWPAEYKADPDPDYGKTDLADKVFPDNPQSPKKITQAVQKDIRGKVAMLLTVAGAGWASRDPYCGGEFLNAVPDRVRVDEQDNTEIAPGLASALTDIFIDSPEIVNWFTTSGKYMKYLTLATVLQPLLVKLWAHHISHSVQPDGEQAAPDWSMYATR